MRAKFAHKTKTELETLNPVLLDGEVIFEKDTKGIKVGDKLTVIATKGSYKGVAQLANGIYFSHESAQ